MKLRIPQVEMTWSARAGSRTLLQMAARTNPATSRRLRETCW